MPPTTLRIALLEDDPDQGMVIASWLRERNHAVTHYVAGQDIVASLRRHPFDAVVLDKRVPDLSGMQVLKWIRNDLGIPIPVIMITSHDEEADVVEALASGADDYLVKPYDPEELLARLRAVQRRLAASGDGRQPIVRLGAVEIDLARETVRRDGVPLVLTPKEWALLRVLASRPDWLHTREALLDALYGFDAEADSNTLEVFVSRLRRKLGREAIQTQRGLGYRLLTLDAPPAARVA